MPGGTAGFCLVVQEVHRGAAARSGARESEERLRVALDATDVGAVVLDARSGEITWDDTMQRMHGRNPPSCCAYVDELVTPTTRAVCFMCPVGLAQHGSTDSLEFRIVRPGRRKNAGCSRPQSVSQRAREWSRAWVGCSTSTENRELKNLLEQAQKMEAIGGLPPGIAHNFNKC